MSVSGIPTRKGAPLLERLMARVSPCPLTGCWWWMGGMAGRYGIACLAGDQVVGAHVAMLMAHGVEIPAGSVVRHKCDMPLCVNPDHLLVGTQAQNIDDMMVRGRHVKAHVLPPMVRQQIRDDHTPAWAVALWFGVSRKTINNIRREAP